MSSKHIIRNFGTTAFDRKIKRKRLNELGYKSYEDYLDSEHWKELRVKIINKQKGSCSICKNSLSLQIHHRTYKNLGKETDECVVGVCKDCHQKIHKTARTTNCKSDKMLRRAEKKVRRKSNKHYS